MNTQQATPAPAKTASVVRDVPEPKSVMTIAQFCEVYPAFTINGMRQLVLKQDENGLSENGAFMRTKPRGDIRSRIFIDTKLFFEWLRMDKGSKR